MREFACDCGQTHGVVLDPHPLARFVPEFLTEVLHETIETTTTTMSSGRPTSWASSSRSSPRPSSPRTCPRTAKSARAGWVTDFDSRRLHEIVVELLVELMEHAVSHAEDDDVVSEFEAKMLQFDVGDSSTSTAPSATSTADLYRARGRRAAHLVEAGSLPTLAGRIAVLLSSGFCGLWSLRRGGATDGDPSSGARAVTGRPGRPRRDRGRVDARRLAAAHRRATRNRSYVLGMRLSRSGGHKSSVSSSKTGVATSSEPNYQHELHQRCTPPEPTLCLRRASTGSLDRNAAANPGSGVLDPDPARLIEADLATNVSVDRPRDDRDSCSVTLRLRTRRRRSNRPIIQRAATVRPDGLVQSLTVSYWDRSEGPSKLRNPVLRRLAIRPSPDRRGPKAPRERDRQRP